MRLRSILLGIAITMSVAMIGDMGMVEYWGGVYWDDIRFPASATQINPATAKPDQVTLIGGTKTLGFDPSSDECVTFAAQMPHGYKIGTDLQPHVHWTPGNDSSTEDVVWCLECTPPVDVGGVIASTSTDCATDSTDGTAYRTYVQGFVDIDMSGVTGVSAMIMCSLCRDADNAGDTLSVDALLLEVDLHVQLDSGGSRSPYAK